MANNITRRQMLQSTGAVALAASLGTRRAAAGQTRAEVGDVSVISKQPQLYNGWPTLTRRRNGQLLVVCSGGREAHVCPFGRVEMMRSDDNGQTWSWPRVVLDSGIDDRDAGVLETDKGSILVTTFTSLAYEPILKREMSKGAGDKNAALKGKIARWNAAHGRLSDEQRQRDLGVWMVRSTDGGATFSERYACGVNSPHGPIQLADGRILYAGKELWQEPHRVGVAVSNDDGQSWKWLAEIPTRPGDDRQNYHELHAVEASDGRIIVQIRNHNKTNDRETLQSESSDGGKTWSIPHSIGVWGLPSHLLRLKDNRLLMTYGHRRKPFGNQARVSDDYGRTWSDALTVSNDAPSTDLGYPSTVELDDSSLLSVWYEVMKGSHRAVLRQARWSLKS